MALQDDWQPEAEQGDSWPAVRIGSWKDFG
jgi:hypothetical protein